MGSIVSIHVLWYEAHTLYEYVCGGSPVSAVHMIGPSTFECSPIRRYLKSYSFNTPRLIPSLGSLYEPCGESVDKYFVAQSDIDLSCKKWKII